MTLYWDMRCREREIRTHSEHPFDLLLLRFVVFLFSLTACGLFCPHIDVTVFSIIFFDQSRMRYRYKEYIEAHCLDCIYQKELRKKHNRVSNCSIITPSGDSVIFTVVN